MSPADLLASRNRGLPVGIKFALTIALVTAFVVGIGAAVVVQKLRADASRQSQVAAQTAASRIALAVQSVFDQAIGTIDGTEAALSALKDKGVTDPLVYDTILRRLIDTGADRYGAWFVWFPDRSPVKTQSPGARYATYWHQNGMEIFQDALPKEILDSKLYRVPAESGDSFLLEPHMIEAVAADPTLVTSFSRTMGEDGKSGVIAVDIKLESVGESLSNIDLPPGAKFIVVSDGGVIAASTGKDEAGRLFASLGPQAAAEFAVAQKIEKQVFTETAAGDRMLRQWSSIRFNGAKKAWHLLLEVPEQSVFATAGSDKLFLLLVPAGALVLILAFVFLSMELIVSRPLKALSAIITGLGNGLFDFQVPGLKRADEVGDIARAIDRLQESGIEIARLQEASGGAEFAREKQRKDDLKRISARFSRTIETLVGTLQEAATVVDVQASEVSAKTDAALQRLADVSGASTFAKDSFGSVADAAHSLVSAISAIDEKTRESEHASAQVQQRLATTDMSILDLRTTVIHIEDSVRQVSAIAAQINMIALNATIEAARAGESGLGFAIVAQEVKALAAQSERAASSIASQIAAVQDAFRGADGRVGDMRDAFQGMTSISASIVETLGVQSNATHEIGDLVARALERAGGVERDMTALIASSSHIRGAANSMRQQSALLSEEIGGLGKEVEGFLAFLKAA